jgi:hypothetical protein
MINASDCAKKAGKYAFGLDEAQTAEMLHKLADEIAAGKVALHSVSTSSQATHDQFTIRELVIEILEETPMAGPRMVRN